jgi:uncharacterized membrane protein (UPF0127 family)
MKVVDITNGMVLAEHAELANSWRKRFRGLMFRKHPKALIFKGRHLAVHSWFVRWPIDLLYLFEGRAVATDRLKPWRFYSPQVPVQVLVELPAGTLERCGVKVGDKIKLEEKSDNPPATPG